MNKKNFNLDAGNFCGTHVLQKPHGPYCTISPLISKPTTIYYIEMGAMIFDFL